MSRMIQIRNVPDDVHQELKIRAARANQTLSDYLGELVAAHVARPTLREWVRSQQERTGPGVRLDEIVESVRAGRDE